MVLADSFYYQPVQIDTIYTRVNADLFAKEGDANGRGMVVQITENGIIKDTTGITLRLQWSHLSVVTSGFTDFEVVDSTKGLYKVKYPTSMLHRGRVEAFIRITDNGILSGTRNLMITVERMVGSDETIEASDDFSALQTALTKLSAWEAAYRQEIISLKRELAEAVTFINVKKSSYGVKGDGVTDDTLALQAIFDTPENYGSTIYFPEGTYKITSALNIKYASNILGAGKRVSVIKQFSAGADCITIPADMERGTIRDVGIFGNGTLQKGADATSGCGIVLNNNSVIWTFENCWLRMHGGHGIFTQSLGHVNNINILKCEIEQNNLDGVYIVSDNNENQVNAIYIENCNIAGNGRNGIGIWGSSINIFKNTIQGNQGYGVSINADYPLGISGAGAIAIEKNYFELNKSGFIYGKSSYSSGNKYNYIIGLNIKDNFGSQDLAQSNEDIVALVKIENPTGTSDNPQVRRVSYIDNEFGSADVKIADFSNSLGSDSIIRWSNMEHYPANYISNMGAAKFEWLKELVVSGLMAKGVNYSNPPQKSDNIMGNATVYFPIPVPLYSTFRRLGIFIDSDSTDYSVWLTILKKDKKSVANYVGLIDISFSNKAGSQYLESSFLGDVNVLPSGEDIVLRVTVTINVAGTYLSLGNPCITYI